MSLTSIKRRGWSNTRRRGAYFKSDSFRSSLSRLLYFSHSSWISCRKEVAGCHWGPSLELRVVRVLKRPPQLTIGNRTPSLMLENPVNNTIFSLHKAHPLRKIMQTCPRTIPVRQVGLKPVNMQHLFELIVIHPIGGLRQAPQHLSSSLPLAVQLGVNRGAIQLFC